MLGVPGIGTSVKEMGQAFEKYSPSYVNLHFLFKPTAVWAFLQLQQAGLLSSCSAWASHCSRFSSRAWALGTRASVVAEHRLNSCGDSLDAP